jgi:hypothetical protein
MTVGIALALISGFDVVGMLAVYAAVFLIAALLYLGTAVRGPIALR